VPKQVQVQMPLRSFIDRLGLKVSAAARLADVSEATMKQWAAGLRPAPPDIEDRIKRALLAELGHDSTSEGTPDSHEEVTQSPGEGEAIVHVLELSPELEEALVKSVAREMQVSLGDKLPGWAPKIFRRWLADATGRSIVEALNWLEPKHQRELSAWLQG